MKKIIFSIMIIILCTCTLISCNGSDTTTTESTTTNNNIAYEYKITYELDDGINNENNPSGYNSGETVSLDFPTKEDYMFAGWYTDSSLTTEITEIKGREENITLYAKWIPLEDAFRLFLTDDGYTLDRFYNNAKTVIIPSTYKGLPIAKISLDAFFDRTKMEEIFIPSNITSIFQRGQFSGCSSLRSITVDEGSTSFKSVDGVLYSKDGKTLICYPEAKMDKTFDIPQGTEVIAENAFSNNPYIVNINIPDSVTKIFQISYCTALESLVIPESVTQIENFSGCNSIKSITLSSNIEIIPYGAFMYCSSLESVVIPNGVKGIGDFAFCYCSSLKSITIPESVERMSSTSIYKDCSEMLTVYCEAESKPDSWDEHWNQYVNKVIWGYTE